MLWITNMVTKDKFSLTILKYGSKIMMLDNTKHETFHISFLYSVGKPRICWIKSKLQRVIDYCRSKKWKFQLHICTSLNDVMNRRGSFLTLLSGYLNKEYCNVFEERKGQMNNQIGTKRGKTNYQWRPEPLLL